jgi:hypothetical protein
MKDEKIKTLVSEYQKDFEKTDADLVRLDVLEKGFTEQEADEVIEALTKGPTKAEAATKSVAKPVVDASPNELIKARLAKIDYQNLHWENFAEYYELVESLPADKMFDFEIVKVEAIQQTRFEGVPGSPIDTIGVKVISTQAVSTTRVHAKTAITQNGRITRGRNFFEIVGQQFHQNRLFYLLKKK